MSEYDHDASYMSGYESAQVDLEHMKRQADEIGRLRAEAAYWRDLWKKAANSVLALQGDVERLTRELAELGDPKAGVSYWVAETYRLRAALERAHAKIRMCVTAGVLRADLNQFLCDEAEALRGADSSPADSRTGAEVNRPAHVRLCCPDCHSASMGVPVKAEPGKPLACPECKKILIKEWK